jgi:hypothetical protein
MISALIDVLLREPAVIFYILSGIAVILYSCFAKRMSFQGDFPTWRPEEIKTYEATPKMRLYGIVLGALPLLYVLYLLFFPSSKFLK